MALGVESPPDFSPLMSLATTLAHSCRHNVYSRLLAATHDIAEILASRHARRWRSTSPQPIHDDHLAMSCHYAKSCSQLQSARSPPHDVKTQLSMRGNIRAQYARIKHFANFAAMSTADILHIAHSATTRWLKIKSQCHAARRAIHRQGGRALSQIHIDCIRSKDLR